MSTFSGLNTAHTALVAARRGLDVVGQNIANANTDGYTRQRINTSAIGAVANVGPISAGTRIGQGVSVNGIDRLGNLFLEATARNTGAAAAQWSVQARTLSAIEATLHEPGDAGLSASLGDFWAAWQDVSNRAGEPASTSVLLETAGSLTDRIAQGYAAVEDLWQQTRREAEGTVTGLNNAGARLAELNALIRSTQNAGGNVNEMLDQRAELAARIASLAGGTARETADGNYEVLLDGNPLVSGDRFNPVTIAGSHLMRDAEPVRLEWAHRPGAIALTGGELASMTALLAPASDGAGGLLAETAEQYNALANDIAERVNAVHRTGETRTGATGLDFFAFDAGIPAALALRVIPTGVDGVATALPGAGAFNGGIADQISQIGQADGGPGALWSSTVTGLGVAARTAAQRSSLAELAHASAVGDQLAHASVDLDEENIAMVTHQHAYQGAARVMTAVDEMLDTLINRTGIVGR